MAAWDSGTRGPYTLDIVCPSPIYAPAACCLSDGSCVSLTPSQCEAIGGAYQGSGTECLGDADTNGIDDVCEIGACCTIELGCVPTSHDFCLGPLGGVDFIPGARCPEQEGDPDPCAGACCRWVQTPPPPGAGHWECTVKPEKICVGTWYEGEECGGPGGTPPWFDCPDDSVCVLHPEMDSNCQEPTEDGVEGIVGSLSDENPWTEGAPPEVPANRTADDFIPLASGIEMVCWWGLYLDLNPDEVPPAPECDIGDDLFTISYYTDNNGCPGTLHAQYTEKGTPTLTVVKTTAGWRAPNTANSLVYEYEGRHASLAVTIGDCYWLEIVNDTGPSSCAWFWAPSPFAEGNGYSVQENGLPGSTAEWDCTDLYDPDATSLNRFDLAWCLNVPNTPCDFCRELLPGDPEGEPICYDEYVDTYNHGCNVCEPDTACTTDLFTDIACGQLIRGTAGTFEGHPSCDTAADCDPLEECIGGKCTGDTNNQRDTDWYKFVLTGTEPTEVKWCVYAEFPALTGLINTFAQDSCPPNIGWAALSQKPMCLNLADEKGTCTRPQNLAPGTWYGYIATSTRLGAPCGSEYEVCLDCGGRGCGAQGCECLDVWSVVLHGGIQRRLHIGCSDGIEPRVGQITKLEIDLDSSASVNVFDTASVTCSTAWDGAATVTDVSTNGSTVTVEFAPPLPNNAKCTITLDCMTRLSEVCVRNIEGDMNGDGTCNTTDASAVKLRFGQTVTDANARWDFNRDGLINTTDASAVKLRFGNTAPGCP